VTFELCVRVVEKCVHGVVAYVLTETGRIPVESELQDAREASTTASSNSSALRVMLHKTKNFSIEGHAVELGLRGGSEQDSRPICVGERGGYLQFVCGVTHQTMTVLVGESDTTA
jgi:hypothetical protein